MNIDILFSRTDKGHSALTDKYMNLPHSLKRALIIVDGSRDVGELHTMAPLYDDLDEALQTLESEGFIEPSARKSRHQPKVAMTNKPGGAGETGSEANHADRNKSIKWRLISLIQVELGSKLDPKIKAASEKMIRDISTLREDYDALSSAWKKCVKVTKITIDEELAETIRRRGEELLVQLKN